MGCEKDLGASVSFAMLVMPFFVPLGAALKLDNAADSVWLLTLNCCCEYCKQLAAAF
jgi:hypothetical protein